MKANDKKERGFAALFVVWDIDSMFRRRYCGGSFWSASTSISMADVGVVRLPSSSRLSRAPMPYSHGGFLRRRERPRVAHRRV